MILFEVVTFLPCQLIVFDVKDQTVANCEPLLIVSQFEEQLVVVLMG